VTTGWREGVERDLGRLTAELAQRAAAIDDAYAAIDALSGWGRVEDLEAAVAGLRDDHATLLRVVDERELRAFASEGRLAALETAAEACSERLRTLEQAAMAAAEEARRVRAATDCREHDERLRALERRLESGATLAGDARSTERMLISTMNDLPGWRIEEVLGQVFGLTVRSRNVGSQLGASLESLADGRAHAIRRLVEEAERKGANAIFAFRFDTSQLGTGTEVCAYGTAVRARRAS
jgi:uncharacterized protein YbjQ (UPF0145 family)